MYLQTSDQLLAKDQKQRTWWQTMIWSAVILLLVGGGSQALFVQLFKHFHISNRAFWCLMLQFPVMLLAIFIIGLARDNRSLGTYGFKKRDLPGQFFTGLLSGLLAFALVWTVAFLTGSISFGFADKVNWGQWLIIFVCFIVQGTCEEVLFQGFLMNKIRVINGSFWAVVISSGLFALAHGLNPGLTQLAIINLVLFGIVFALLFIYTDNIYLTGAAHGMWNFAQGAIFGVKVSGIKVPTTTLVSTVEQKSPAWLNGKPFGLAGSIITTGLGSFLVLLLLLLLWHQKRVLAKTVA
ncbi:CPBP family intramembrane glutamic endopeptidase [Lactobacillus corticis]|uniref:CAAX prenyl protease 2/Lysostaphin resistance protein A-like domain-containing protein n=1 Tax=Lactobacillus corticis TaxID=2201249 RepID=A0A916QKA9_9LACO|nr:type II CAAX endopeptidase family protein [Lactobacillus corticis]GFZ26856.1 hypothetical protein LCB40_07360 [Lactobacillus corticis]